MLTVEIGIEGSKSRTKGLESSNSREWWSRANGIQWWLGLGLGLVTPQSSQLQPAISSLQVLSTQVRPTLYVPAGGFTLSFHFTLQSIVEAIPIAPFSLSSNSCPACGGFNMAGSAHIQTGIPSLVVATPWANNDWQCRYWLPPEAYV